MQNITSSIDLKIAIQLLEQEQTVKGQLLKEQFDITYKSFKPANLLKSSFSDIVSSPYIIDNIIGTVAGMATGYISKKLFIGASSNIIRKMMGSFMQIGVTNVVSHHPEAVKSVGKLIFKNIFHKKDPKTA